MGLLELATTQRRLIASVMDDHSGARLRKCGALSDKIFTDPVALKLWRFAKPGVNGHTPAQITEKARLKDGELVRVRKLLDDGDLFESDLAALRHHRREAIRAEISGLTSDPKTFDAAAIIALSREIDALEPAAQPKLKATPLSRFSVPPRDDRSVLLGNRYLNRGDGGIIVSSSGMGKSSLYVLAAVLWALGRPFFGITPNGPLRSLLAQSEDSDGDIAEVWISILHALQLTEAEIALVESRVIVVTDRVHRGQPFIAELRKQIEAHKPDLVWINPLVAFLDGDVKEASDAGRFLREGLNGLNANCEFGYIIIHHTTKPPNAKDAKERNWSEIMYDMAGSYDLIGWARFIISLRPTEEAGQFNMVLAKRGVRAGVTKEIEQGAGVVFEPSTTIPLRHSTELIDLPSGDRIRSLMWHERDADVAKITKSKAKRAYTFSQFREKITQLAPDEANAKRLPQLYREIRGNSAINQKAFEALLLEAKDGGLLQLSDRGYYVRTF